MSEETGASERCAVRTRGLRRVGGAHGAPYEDPCLAQGSLLKRTGIRRCPNEPAYWPKRPAMAVWQCGQWPDAVTR
ncbi:hypothetical protein D3C84_960550 [compost metagenome]